MTLWDTHQNPTSKTPKSDDPFDKLVPKSSFDSSFKEFDKKDSSFTRPTEIPWQKKVSNLVKLIGRVEAPVEFCEVSDGKTWAATVISQEKKGSVSLRYIFVYAYLLQLFIVCVCKNVGVLKL